MLSNLFKNNKTVAIFSFAVAVFVFVTASLVANNNTNILSEASLPNTYPRLSLSCLDCSANRLNRLCFNRLKKTSYCTSAPVNDPYANCVSCPITLTSYPTRYPTMTSYPRVTPTLYPRPTCVPWPTCTPGTVCPAFPIDNSGYWCLPTVYPEPTCVPPPPCVYSEPFCGGIAPPPGGWCPITPTPTCSKYETICDPAYPNVECRPKLVCVTTPTPQICLQQFTWGRNITTRECKLFPTSCMPDGWVRDPSCNPTASPYPTGPYPTRIYPPTGYVCPSPPYCNGRLEVKQGDPTAGMYPCPEYFCIAQ